MHKFSGIFLWIVNALFIGTVSLLPQFTSRVYGQAITVRFENISTEQGLSQNTVNAILQDRQGFLWVATEGGLDQYDGYQFTVYQHDSENSGSLSNNITQSLFEDRDGTLWVGTTTGLDRLDRSTGAFIHYRQYFTGSDAESNFRISAIAQDQKGTLWVGTNGNGLYALDLTTNRVVGYRHQPENPQSLSNDSINSIYVDREGEIWIGTNDSVDLFNQVDGSFIYPLKEAKGSPIPGTVPIRTIYEDGQGTMWLGTQDGLVEWNKAANQFELYTNDPNNQGSLIDSAIQYVYGDDQGLLWVGTNSGLSIFDKSRNQFTRYQHDTNNPYGLSSNYIRSIFEDRSGVVWIGTSDGGLNKYSRSTQKFALYSSLLGSPYKYSDNNIWAIYKDRNENLWIGTFFSGLNQLNLRTDKVTIYQNDPADPKSLSNDEIRAILQDRNGALWIGTEHGGLNRFDPGTSSFIRYQNRPDDPTSISSDHVFDLYEDREGRLWIGTEFGGLDLFDQASGTFIHYLHNANDPTSLSDNNARAILEDDAGVLWVGTELGGLDRWDSQKNQFKAYRHDPENPASLSNDWITSIMEDNIGAIWIGTYGGGLDRFDRNTQTFTTFTVKNGLPDDTIFGILKDAEGNLWLSTNKGISKVNPKTGTFRNYDISDGLQGNQFNPGAFFQADDGEMFFGGTRGLNAYYPQQVNDNPIPPPVVITAFQKYNQTIQTDLAANETIQLSYHDNFISFEFAALDFNAPEKNQYAYMLEGVDKDWIDAGTRRYVSYANLKGGDYVFRVKASNNDGVWNSEATTLRIHITPPFWETWWFIGLAGMVVVLAVGASYSLRVRNVQARNRELAVRVERRTRELAALNTISGVVNRSLNLTEILNNALDKTLEVMHMDAGLAYGLEKPTNGPTEEPSLNLLAHQGVSADFVSTVKSLRLRETLAYDAVKEGKPVIHHPRDHPNPRAREAYAREGICLVVSIPLSVKGRLVGSVSLGTRALREIAPEELILLGAIGHQVGMAVENARLYEQAKQTAITTERTRLARELHDSVTQLLYSVTLYAEAASELLVEGDKETAAIHLRELRDTALEALREMRLLIFELHRPALGKGGLGTALQARLDAVETRGGIHAELLVDGNELVPTSVQEELYNIAHEALNNIIKHAHANHVWIHLQYRDNMTELEISDDGTGFDPGEGIGGGFGISGMKERSQKIGGSFQIISAPGKGTQVTIRVPANTHEQPPMDETGLS